MKICFMRDINLPSDADALQYDAFRWAIDDITKKKPGFIVHAGEVTCDGNTDAYNYFAEKMKSLNIPFLLCTTAEPGYSQICEDAQITEFCCKSYTDGSIVFAFDDRNGSASEYTLNLQTLNPDKATGENPCISYFNTDTGELRKACYFCPVPTDLYRHFAIACSGDEKDMELAVQNELKSLELRSDCLELGKEKLLVNIEKWRKNGGDDLSVHLPDVAYEGGEVIVDELFDECVDLAKRLNANRVTMPMPAAYADEVRSDETALEKICSFLAERLSLIDQSIVIGIENADMMSKAQYADSRNFGCTPEECIQFVQLLSSKCKHRAGIVLDVGNAANNAYPLSVWFAMAGKYIAGYRIYQPDCKNGLLGARMPITGIYGPGISYASFFRCWLEGKINKAPVTFDMSEQGAYDTTLKTFGEYKRKNVFDIHSHTYYSNCGRDNPHDLIDTAIKNGLSVLGISDHNYGIGRRKEEYIKEIRALAKEYEGKIKLLCGIEIATLPDLYDLKSRDEIKECDYCLVEHITEPNNMVGGNMIEFCSGLGVLCGIAHTDLFGYCDTYGYDYEEFFAKMAESGIFWEMNVSYDSIHRYSEHQYVIDFMRNPKQIEIVKNAGVYVSVGFDSHRCEDYDGFRVHQMYDFLKSNGFKTIDEILCKS